jgi:hypothetical protein
MRRFELTVALLTQVERPVRAIPMNGGATIFLPNMNTYSWLALTSQRQIRHERLLFEVISVTRRTALGCGFNRSMQQAQNGRFC